MRLRTNKQSCECGGSCRSNGAPRTMSRPITMTANLMAGSRREDYEGRAHIIVPVIMARADVPMNGAIIPPDELIPQSWNGVPVTAGHPRDGDAYQTANSPDALSRWSIGKIFNARVDGSALKAEAWIDVERAERVAPGLVAEIESGRPIDVSTGYYSASQASAGEVSGREYDRVHYDIKPDHLALLPNEAGACSWADGCGVRANRKGLAMTAQEFLDAIKAAVGVTGNARGNDDDYRQMVADLISDDRSPFLPDDELSLREMSRDTLRRMRDDYLREKTDNKRMEVNVTDDNKAAGPVTVNADDIAAKLGVDADTAKKMADAANAKAPAQQAPALDEASIRETVTNAMRDALPKILEEQRRPALIEKVIANTKVTAEEAAEMPTKALEAIANSVRPAPAYFGGRPMPSPTSGSGEDKAAALMLQSLNGSVDAAAEKKDQ